jgi:CubicO group peptidase (beta-lactamase class C family)
MRSVRALFVFSFLSLAAAANLASAQVPPDANVRVDSVFAPWNSVDMPGCAVGVAVNGLTVLSRAYGMADLEHNIPNTPATIFEGGSVSKQFTAAAVILLALDGVLSLDDDVRKYVPEVPDYGTTITLRHLLTHTSGLRDWGSVAEISGWGRQQRTHTHAHVLDILSRQTALNFPPGHEYSYCNSGFNLLAIIVGRVSGMSFAEFSKQRVFEPLGMLNTQWRDDYTRIVKGRSTAYDVRGDTVSIMRPIEDVHGNGGLLTTVGDLLIWNESLEHGRLGGPEFKRMMHQQGRLNDGRTIAYSAGLFVEPFAGVPSVTHTGSTSGYRAFLGRYPEQGLSIAMLCNASNAPTSGNGERIARIYLGDAAHDPAPPEAVDVPQRELERLTGLYRDVQTGLPTRLTIQDGQLRMDRRTRLIPVSRTTFAIGNSDRRLVVGSERAGRPTLTLRTGEYDDGTLQPVDEYQPTETELHSYEGQYYSPDAETMFTVVVGDSGLVVLRRPDARFALEPVYRDAFEMQQYGLVRFEHDSTGKVVELRLYISRVYDMRFPRVEQ